jgi:hypothetical protein
MASLTVAHHDENAHSDDGDDHYHEGTAEYLQVLEGDEGWRFLFFHACSLIEKYPQDNDSGGGEDEDG